MTSRRGLAVTLVLAGWHAIAPGRAARAEIAVELSGNFNLNYNDATGTVSQKGFVLDLRPGIVLQTGEERLAWRAGYTFAGAMDLNGNGAPTYANQADLSLAVLLGKRSTMILSAGVTQGGTAFQLSQRAPDAGQPTIRAPGNPSQVATTFTEGLAWEVSPSVSLSQGLTAAVSAPQSDLGRFNTTAGATLGLERRGVRNALGVELRSSPSWLVPPVGGVREWTLMSSLVGHWSRDLGARWSGQAAAGVQQTITFAGSYPLAILPAGSLTATYLYGSVAGSLNYSHAAAANVETGTIALSDQVSLRGSLPLGGQRPVALGASAGYLHTRPLGEAPSRVAVGTGDAVQVDFGLSWGLSESLVASARYSLAYQFNQPEPLEPSIAHVLLIGISARYRNVRHSLPMPSLGGQRVDGSDAVGF